MSAGAIYTASNNDGAMDELLYMTAILARRLGELTQARLAMRASKQAAGEPVDKFSITPSLGDVAASHTVLPYKTYKPYVITTFQYLKNRIATGNISLGSDATFPQQMFGEFITDSMLAVETSALVPTQVDLRAFVVANPTALPPNTFNGNNVLTVANNSFLIAADLGVVPVVLNTIEDAQGNLLMDRGAFTTVGANPTLNEIAAAYPNPINVSDYVSYADYPIHALIRTVHFQITNNDIDQYTTERDNFHILYMLPSDKKAAYFKCICQELPTTGYSDLITNYTVGVNDTIPGYATGNVISARQQISVMMGYQTPKAQQPGLRGMYPNKFDHCRCVENSLPVLTIPNTDRTYIYNFNTQDKLVFFSAANVFKVKATVTLTSNGLAANVSSQRTVIERTPLLVGSGLVTPMTFTNVNLFVNNVFIDPSIHNIYLERVGFILTRVHRIQTINVNTNEGDYTLSAFKWPLEFMFLGLRPSTNATVNPQRNWWKYSYQTELAGYSPSYATSLTANQQAASYNATRSMYRGNKITYDLESPTIDTLSISLQTISLYEAQSAQFYNAYLPYTFGGYNITTNPESSSLFVTFTFGPNNDASPLGHVNLSRSREFNVKYTSSVIGQGNIVTNGVLIAMGIVMNFLINSSGNLYLRFS